MSNLTIIFFVVALLLGALGYLEKIFDFKLSRKVHIFLLLIFISIYAGHFISSYYDNLSLKNNLHTVENKLDTEITKIRDFEARILVKFSGDWPTGKGFGGFPLYTDRSYLKLTGKDNKNIEMKFYTIKPYILKGIDKEHSYFESVQAIHKGEYPLGQNVAELSKIKNIEYVIPLLSQPFKTNKLTLDYQEFDFIINGESVCKVVTPSPFEADIKSKNGSSWVNINLELLNENLYDYIKEWKHAGHNKTAQITTFRVK